MTQAGSPQHRDLAKPGDYRELVDSFEKAWRSGTVPQIQHFLPPTSSGLAEPEPGRRKLLEELVKLDLEYRWRQPPSPDSKPWLLEEYAAHHPELGPPDAFPLDMIGEEYRVRQRWGDRPGQAGYLARFAQHGPKLQALLARADAELASEFNADRPPSPATASLDREAPPPSPAFRSSAELVEALRHCQILSPPQLKQIVQLQAGAPQPQALAAELLRREWLTPYQVNQLFLGRGQDLLVGPYLVLERLGEGGTGQVFKARHQKMNRIVALKVIRKDLMDDSEVVGRFYREIRVIGQLSHPNIVGAYDAGPIGPTHVLVMEYVVGIDLDRLVKQSGPLPVAEARDYVRQAAVGLQYAHERGLVHRDIKPSNLLVASGKGLVAREEKSESARSLATSHQPQATVKILDLGLARLQKTSAQGDITGVLTPLGAAMIGTPNYLAPEQAINFHAADIRADIYGLGCTLYFLLTGQPPFPGGSLAEKLSKHLQAEPPPLEQFRADIPAWLPPILRKMLAKKPEDRYQTPAELVQALAAGAVGGAAPVALAADSTTPLGAVPIAVPISAGPHEPGTTSVGRPRALTRKHWLILATVPAFLLVAGFVALLTPKGSRPTVASQASQPMPTSQPTGVRADPPAVTGKVVAYEADKSITIQTETKEGQPRRNEFAIVKGKTEIRIPARVKDPVGRIFSVWPDKDNPKHAAKIQGIN
jgi:serine/threonine-protein kinase